jgi:putative hydrolase of the HAD superfamily
MKIDPRPKLDWRRIDTVLLDMDGTLLDLHYDNHFWLEHVPRRYADLRGLSVESALADIRERYRRVEGTLDWYCVDYWTDELGLDIETLKQEVDHLIAIHPHVLDFLAAVRAHGKRLMLVTNAHGKAMAIKFRRTRLGEHFDAIVCSHDYGVPKEHPEFWPRLQRTQPFEKSSALFVDDSLPVLRAARAYGIGQLLAVRLPDSRQAERVVDEFSSIRDFSEIMPR